MEAALLDLHPDPGDLRQEVLEGLSAAQKRLPYKLFYDERGSALYEEITRLEEYYPTRTELGIMQAAITELAELLGPNCLIIEYGSGNSEKTRILLDSLERIAAYVPLDISRAHLRRAAADLSAEYPGLEIRPVCADYTTDIDLPVISKPVARRVVYFPGSTIGNFEHEDAVAFLERVAAYCEPGDALLLGVDLKKNRKVLEAAYNDAPGVTARFNLNMLRHINDRLGTDFDLQKFEHRAFYNDDRGRIEMHLVSLSDQAVALNGESIRFCEGETIWTESSYKYTPEEMGLLAKRAGYDVERVWTDQDCLFSVQYFVLAGR